MKSPVAARGGSSRLGFDTPSPACRKSFKPRIRRDHADRSPADLQSHARHRLSALSDLRRHAIRRSRSKRSSPIRTWVSSFRATSSCMSGTTRRRSSRHRRDPDAAATRCLRRSPRWAREYDRRAAGTRRKNARRMNLVRRNPRMLLRMIRIRARHGAAVGLAAAPRRLSDRHGAITSNPYVATICYGAVDTG